ncbi:hypothetical protein KFU94_68250 [Chloroflexi bacterium TSY]|nr:hypothetical protein [Chloroflexi bacterium TSY]
MLIRDEYQLRVGPCLEVLARGDRDQSPPEAVRAPSSVEGKVLARARLACDGDRLQDLVRSHHNWVAGMLAPDKTVGGMGDPVPLLSF